MIKIGDVVTWRPKPRPTILPMAITGATVLELGQDKDGKPAALIKTRFGDVGVLIEDLHLESTDET